MNWVAASTENGGRYVCIVGFFRAVAMSLRFCNTDVRRMPMSLIFRGRIQKHPLFPGSICLPDRRYSSRRSISVLAGQFAALSG